MIGVLPNFGKKCYTISNSVTSSYEHSNKNVLYPFFSKKRLLISIRPYRGNLNSLLDTPPRVVGPMKKYDYIFFIDYDYEF